MASLGVHGASKERMLREIMRVDDCVRRGLAVLAKMNLHLEGGTSLHKLPYQAIIAGAWALGVVLMPLGVFQKDLAIWFATQHVGVDLPPAEEIDTVWKVGTLDVAMDGAHYWHLVFCVAGVATHTGERSPNRREAV